jgi:hypothetical protein
MNSTSHKHVGRGGTRAVCLCCVLFLVAPFAAADDLDEFRIKRANTFEFSTKPQVTWTGDRVTITFTSKAYCDATVVVENSDGKIVRHLASGVLGDNAPAPFQKRSLRQSLVWDGKDDRGRYIDNKQRLNVRVSLGLKPQFERTLFWSPHKRVANACPLLVATAEGIYLFEGRGSDQVKLFDHQGDYVRTIYPFAAEQLAKTRGVTSHDFPQDGKRLPIKHGFVQASLLTSGTSALFAGKYKFGTGYAAQVMAVQQGRIALGYDYINRLATDGTTGGQNLKGPKIGLKVNWRGYGGQGGGEEILGPMSAAFSPDARWLYLTGFMWREFYAGNGGCYQAVLRLRYDDDNAKPEVFVGKMTFEDHGNDNDHFTVPSSVACDAQGRVYVTDFMNDRVQIFDPQGTFLKSIKTAKPAKVLVSPIDGQVWIFSWPIYGASNELLKRHKFDWRKVAPTLTRFGSFENPRRQSSVPLPVQVNLRGFFHSGPFIDVAVDWWAKQPTLWLSTKKHNVSRIDVAWGGAKAYDKRAKDEWLVDGIRMLVEEDGKWQERRNFAKDARQSVKRIKPPDFSRQRLYVNPQNEKLYIAEDAGFDKSFSQMVQIEPTTGQIQLVELPFNCEDMCFDAEGQAYLRTDTLVARYDSKTWRESPGDYGEEHQNVGFSSSASRRRANLISGLRIPGRRPVCWNAGGMGVSPKGHLIVSCCSRAVIADRKAAKQSAWERRRGLSSGKPYTPTMYPGRARWQEIHVWNRHGKLVYEDAFPGSTILNGVEMDARDNLYVMAAPNRVLNGKPYFNEMAGTVVKLKPKQAKVLSSKSRVAIPLAEELFPRRNKDIRSSTAGSAWIEGAEWLYGGVGYGGFNTSRAGGGCHCWNSKFTLDLLARSFAPEMDHYSVAVLDAAGNLILRIGKYGNVDDGQPLVKQGGPASPRSIGGDEVALFHAAFVATHTDRRLYIADGGNARILSVRLGYHATETVQMRDVKEQVGQ